MARAWVCGLCRWRADHQVPRAGRERMAALTYRAVPPHLRSASLSLVVRDAALARVGVGRAPLHARGWSVAAAAPLARGARLAETASTIVFASSIPLKTPSAPSPTDEH